jgi:uncharacterized protein YecE (DUF72 family)
MLMAADPCSPERSPTARARLRVGTSGWGHPQWRGHLYPPGLRTADWLAHYARHFDTVEVNTSFYRLPTTAMLERWAASVPPDFVFALKAPREITHDRRLAACEGPLTAFLDRIALLGPATGPILFQLPPRFPADHQLLERFLALLPPQHRYTIEFRDPSWWPEPTPTILARHAIAFCPFDLAGSSPPRHVTTDFTYVRLHGHERPYCDRYPASVLAHWTAWLRTQLQAGRDAYIFLDNTKEGDAALHDARLLRSRVPLHGLERAADAERLETD